MRIRTIFNLTLLTALTVGLLAIVVFARTVPSSPAVALVGTTWYFSMDPAPTGTFHSPSNSQYLMYQDNCPAGADCLNGGSNTVYIDLNTHTWFGSGSPTTHDAVQTYTVPIPATTWTYTLTFTGYTFRDQFTFTVGYVLASSPTTIHSLGSIQDGCSNPNGNTISCALTNSISGSAATPSGPYYIVFDMLAPDGCHAYLTSYYLTTCWQIPENAMIAAPFALVIPGMLALRVKVKSRKHSD